MWHRMHRSTPGGDDWEEDIEAWKSYRDEWHRWEQRFHWVVRCELSGTTFKPLQPPRVNKIFSVSSRLW